MKIKLALVVFVVSSILLVVVGFDYARYAPSESYEGRIEVLWHRAEHLTSTANELEDTYYAQIRPIYVDLLSTGRVRNNNTALMTAVFIRKYALMADVNPLLVSAIVKVENPWLVHDTASFAGALGVMQVMPSVWSGQFPDCGDDLTDLETNVCTGIEVLARYLDAELIRALDRTLLRYNGCVSTPGCTSYTRKVLGDKNAGSFLR